MTGMVNLPRKGSPLEPQKVKEQRQKLTGPWQDGIRDRYTSYGEYTAHETPIKGT